MSRITFSLALALCVATACGGGHSTAQVAAAPGSSHATPTSPANTTRLIHDAAQCIRDHGVPNFPDPVIDSRGNIQIDNAQLKNLPAAVQQSAQNACKSQVNAVEQAIQIQKPPATPKELAQLTKFSQCMRRHGWPNFPDPNVNGSFTGSTGGALPAKNDPSFQTCRSLLPTRGA